MTLLSKNSIGRFARLLLLCACGTTAASPGWALQAPDAPAPRPAVPQTYVLQPLDEVAIAVNPAGAALDTSAIIAPDGVLYLKGIGNLPAAGLSIPQLSERIHKMLQKILLRPSVSVTLTKLAPLPPPNKITVGGSVTQPGPRDLTEGLRVAKAIDLAAGATKDADLSKIVIVHKDLTQVQVDLSTAEKHSDPKQNLVLVEGDSVFVPALAPKEIFTITLTGAVLKTGPIQLDEAPRVFKAIELAGGILKDADLSRVSITHKDFKRTIVDLSNSAHILDASRNLELKDGDSVEVPSTPLVVSIRGAVVKPGTFDLKPEMGIEDLITEAGMMTILADTANIELRRRGEAPQFVDLEKALEPNTPRMLLKPGDQIIVREHPNRVLLAGAIDNAGFRPLMPGQTVRDLLLSGNADTASSLNNTKIDLAKAQLIRKGKPAEPINVKQILKNPKDKGNVVLASGDIILLPGKEMKSPSQLLQGAGVLGQLARFFVF